MDGSFLIIFSVYCLKIFVCILIIGVYESLLCFEVFLLMKKISQIYKVQELNSKLDQLFKMFSH